MRGNADLRGDGAPAIWTGEFWRAILLNATFLGYRRTVRNEIGITLSDGKHAFAFWAGNHVALSCPWEAVCICR
jgi:hypothetical protein